MKLKYLKYSLLNLIILLICVIEIQNQYEIPSYYGFWSRNFYKNTSIQSGKFSVFEMHFSLDMDFTNQTIYFVNQREHCVLKFNISTY